jgi:phenylalanyl-tRNA synthetase alpha chain
MLKTIKQIGNLEWLQKLYSDTFGKNGTMTLRLKGMRELSDTARAALNAEKEELQAAFKARQAEIENEAMMAALAVEKIDATRSSEPEQAGKLHPLTMIWKDVARVFQSMGYELADGPQIEDDFHQFEALNIPKYHPARDMQDTFYIDGTENLLRGHTTTISVREMTKRGAATKVIAPGATYRRDMDATHSPFFHQYDGVVLGKNITLSDLVSDIMTYLRLIFETGDISVRIRPSFFPFTEPSIEYDIMWDKKTGRLVKDGGDWLEMGGAGMLHPNVLRASGINPDEMQGFAFGPGLDRLAMLKYGLNDIRKFFDGDIRWLQSKGF